MKQHKNSSSVNNLEKIKIEKIRLNAFCTYQEKMISYKVNYLIENYPKMVGDALLPYDSNKNREVSNVLDAVNEFIANILPGIFRGRRLPGFLLKLVEIIMIRTFGKTRK